MDLIDTSSPGRMWTLARDAGNAGWDVRIVRAGAARSQWLLRLTHHASPAVAEARWTFAYKTQPGPDSPGSWRIGPVHASLGGRQYDCKLADLGDLIGYPPMPGQPVEQIARTLGQAALDALSATAAGQVGWDGRFPAQPDSFLTGHTRTRLPALTMPRLLALDLVTAGPLREHPPTREGQSAPWNSRTYAITHLGQTVLAAARPEEQHP